MTSATWEQLTAPLDADDLATLTAFRDFCRGLPGVEERITATQISFARVRSFATAHMKSHYLELADFDERLRELIREAAETVGPGAKRSKPA